MIKGFYIVPDMRSSEIGVNKKFEYHVKEFGKVSDVKLIRVPENKNITRIMMRLPIGSSGCDYDTVEKEIENPDYIYIRKKDMDAKLIGFMRYIKDRYPKCKVLFELPTYPYNKDGLNKWYNFFIIRKDKLYRAKLYRYVDRIVTYSDYDQIFGCRTLKARNGVDCSAIQPITNYSLDENVIRLIGVAQFRQHHGYERVIKGLAEYYKAKGSRNVIFYLVGNGAEKPMYEEIVHSEGLEEHVKFLGSKQGEALDEQYNNADIAVSSLGMYKLGLTNVSPLKNREYLSKGLPIITSFHDYMLEGLDTILDFPNDSSSIDIDRVVSFYESIYARGKQKVIEKNRKVALEKADLAEAYKDIIEYIQQ